MLEQFVEFIEQVPVGSARAMSDRVLSRCRELTGAEAGTVFILRRRGKLRWLEAMSSQNAVVPTRNESFKVPVDEGSIAGYVAASGRTVFIDDAYDIPADRPYRFNPSFDRLTGFRTRSILCFALFSAPSRIIGTVQLINRRGDLPGEPLNFLPDHVAMIAPVNLIVGRAIERADHLERMALKNEKLRQRNHELVQERRRVEALRAETEHAFMLSVGLLARASELHDADTGNHILRVNEYAWLLAGLAGQPKAFCDEIRYSAALHDVGKMSIDKAILHKKGRLDAAEFREMQRHTVYGYEILKASDRLLMAAEIAHCHHEQWTGQGYPRGLVGEAIPLSARIVAIADVYDALRSERPYKKGFGHAQSLEIMRNGDERIDPINHFDPALLRLFAEHHQEFAEIWDRLRDAPPMTTPV
ncbi:MAG: HD domain-containing protein [Azospirillum sp.]|nr:HD domain-containing protein [Azospirillum sp.]